MTTEPLNPDAEHVDVPAPPAAPESTVIPEAGTPATSAIPAASPAPETPVAAPAPTVASAAPARSPKQAPRTSPIVWGSLILVFCAYVFVRAAGGAVDTTTWIITTIIGLGALLLIVGGAVLFRNSRNQ